MQYLTQFEILAKIQNLPNIPVSEYDQTAIFLNELINRGRITDLCIKILGGKKNKVKGTPYSRIQTYRSYSVLPCAPLRYVETDSCMELSEMPVITRDFLDAVILHLGVKLHRKDDDPHFCYIPKAFKPYLLKLRTYKNLVQFDDASFYKECEKNGLLR